MSPSIPSLIVCGSQTIPPTPETLDQLACYLKQAPDLKPVLEAVLSFPESWAILKTANPRLQVLSDDAVISLRDWLSSSPDPDSDNDSYSSLIIPNTLPNILLAPLTVLIHVAQYTQYIDSLGIDDVHAHIQEVKTTPENPDTASRFHGLCIGSLSAAALESSPTRAALGQHAAAGVKLAMCIGAYIDSERLTVSSDMVCFTARWGVGCCRDQVQEILSRHSEAYISVELDINSVTITVLDRDMPSLQREFNSKGVKMATIPVKGCYHSEKNKQILQDLLELCSSGSGPFWVPWGSDKLERYLRSILTEPADWFSSISKRVSSLEKAKILELGLVGCIPPSLAALPHHIIRGSLSAQQNQHTDPYTYPENSLAIIGAACKYPGADSLRELWSLISTGQVMHGEAPTSRFGFTPGSKHTVTGSFISDADEFDCGLFGVSPREATYMDPQQRVALQVAYQAVASSGYIGSPNHTLDVGCYVGVGSSDYESNVNSHTPTAYSFTGTSRAFISGRISHYFKWTGPSLTLDAACSSSASAIHQACNAIAMGDCSAALAGGVNIISSLATHQNIAAAGMTNPTGPCRPFDSDAAGYSRSEGCGFIMLKRLSEALAQGDNILGVIAATATNQSDGSSSITVPVRRSQSALYRRALSRAGMGPADVSYVEAHGTGTRRGDPVEYQSVREVFGGGDMPQSRAKQHKVHIGSVKANIGHTEAASGVAGVLKVLMMLKHGQIPPQANFSILNPAIPTQKSDQVVISTRLQPWTSGFRAACINNYGASGNNTAIIVCQSPRKGVPSLAPQTLARYPFLISAQSQASLGQYCVALTQYLDTKQSLSLAEVAFLVARQQNRSLRHRVVFSASSLSELRHILRSHAQMASEQRLPPVPSKQSKPVVLVFGGQTGSRLYFNKAVYTGSCHLRRHVDKCDTLLRDMGLAGLFPHIFSQDPVADIVILHSCIFTIQYACAAAWLETGLRVDRVIGHSFGQLTAMCISGILTLEDALRLVVGRANLIHDYWGDEKGSMLSIEIDREGAESIARSSGQEDPVEVACYNAPNNHVLVGSESAITIVEKKTESLATRRLKTTHGFHSRLIDPIMGPYLDLARTITYNAPVIPIETCSEDATWTAFTAQLVADHSRKPVYFCDAVRRVERDLGPSIWLEAGSGLGAVMLAKQSLSSKANVLLRPHLGASNAGAGPLESVGDATLELWRHGASIQCWMYHPKDRPWGYSDEAELPGYHFDTSPHWLLSTGRDIDTPPSSNGSSLVSKGGLISLARLSHPELHVSQFEIDQDSLSLAYILRGREVLGADLWPLALYMDVVARAAALLTPSIPSASHLVRFTGLEIKTPLGGGARDGLCLRLRQSNMCAWEFSLQSDSVHAVGTVMVDDERATTGPSQTISSRSRSPLQENNSTVFSLSAPGYVAYKLLEKVIEYSPPYRGIESIKMNDHEAVARVYLPPATEKYIGQQHCNPIFVDQLLVIAEMHALAMEDSKRDEVFACSGLGEATVWMRLVAAAEMGQRWTVYTRQSAKQGREILYDTFVYDDGEGEGAGRLVLSILRARFIRTSTRALEQIVQQVNTPSSGIPISSLQLQDDGSAGVWSLTADILHELTGCLPERISAQMVLADTGIDSLALMELEARIRAIFHVDMTGLVELESTVEILCERIAAQTRTDLGIESSPSTVTTPSSRLTPSGSGSSATSDRGTDATEISLNTSTMARMIKIVASHLSSAEKVLPSSRLHSLGFDSLAILELQSDIRMSFGVALYLMQLDDSTTIEDLHALVIRSGTGTPVSR
ncbi:hypothetical protein BJX99DRAFT_257569 [Aspergillus californicus]